MSGRTASSSACAAGDLGDVAPHYFSFGGAVETARYACEDVRKARRRTCYGSAKLGPAAGPRGHSRRNQCTTHQAAFPRRHGRQPVAHRRDQAGARAAREGRDHAAQLKAVEDREIEKIIKKQEEVGLKLATDGEFRRSWWHFDFYGMLDSVEIYELDHGIQFQGVQTKPRSIHVNGKIGFSDHPMLEHFKFLKAHTKVTPKMCIPAPSTFHFRLEPIAVSKTAYAGRDAIFDDLAVAYQDAIKAFYAAGCRYLQFDDTAWAYLCSQEEMEKARDRGLDVDHLQESYTKCINKALEAKPADMAITTHVCRGNFRSTFISSGGYEPVAEILLAKCNYDGYFLEYDTDRAGGFEPLRFLPKGNKIVVLGLITTKRGGWSRATTSSAASRKRPNLSRSNSSAFAAMRLRLHRGRQRAGRGRAMGEAAHAWMAEEVWGK